MEKTYFVIDMGMGTIAEYITLHEAIKLCHGHSRRMFYEHI